MAKLEPRWATGTFLGRTDDSDEVTVGTAVGVEFARSFRLRTRDTQWQRDAFTTFIGVGGSSDDQQQEEVRHKVPRPTAQRDARLFSMLGSFIAAHDNVLRKIRASDQTVGMKRCAEDNPASSSAKRAHTPPLPLSQVLPQPDFEMGQCRCRCRNQSQLIRPTWKRFSMQLVSSMISTLAKSWIVMRQLLESELSHTVARVRSV